MISSNGVKKSADEVTNGIRKLLGSLPLLKIKIALMNSVMNIVKNNIMIVNITIIMIIKGLIIAIPEKKTTP
jgi:hypothetical protein